MLVDWIYKDYLNIQRYIYYIKNERNMLRSFFRPFSSVYIFLIKRTVMDLFFLNCI